MNGGRLTRIHTLTLGVELELGGQATYAPPGPNFIPVDLEAALNQRPTILAGDWRNAKHVSWHSHSNSSRGIRLLQYAEARGYHVCGPDAATHYPRVDAHRLDTIDLVVHNRPGLYLAQEVLMDEYQSNHQPLLCIIAGAPSPPVRTWKVTDWKAFESIMKCVFHIIIYYRGVPTPGPPDTTTGAVDDMAETMTRQLQTALAEATTTRPPESVAVPLLALRSQWQRNRCPVLKAHLNRLAEHVKAELATHARRTWEHTLGEATTEPTRLFQLCRRLYRTPEPKRPLYADSNGAITYDDIDQAEIFAENIERQFSPNTAKSPARVAEVESAVEARLTSPIPPDEAQILFSPSQVRKTIRRLLLKKVPGPDGMTHQALRHLPMRWIVALARLFTGILRTLQKDLDCPLHILSHPLHILTHLYIALR
ncbi:unnamed protein product [Pieris macdunnoughi]|uniref:Endonuclease/exonuclease/phosphatase domain-containing protein n=1 Tax=Pieris macdunnoughi TaxID=345717 RepID=A0A821UJ10_9NEOP|nr:unnamed protein product [Pieris macdunnoughi]